MANIILYSFAPSAGPMEVTEALPGTPTLACVRWRFTISCEPGGSVIAVRLAEMTPLVRETPRHKFKADPYAPSWEPYRRRIGVHVVNEEPHPPAPVVSAALARARARVTFSRWPPR